MPDWLPWPDVSEWLTAEVIDQLIDGALLTIGVTIVTCITALVVGVVLASLRTVGPPSARRFSAAVTEVFRNIPALIQIIFFAFAVTNVVPLETRRPLFFDNAFVDAVGAITGVPIPYYLLAASLALTLNTGAHLAELIRSGMQTIPTEQLEAARSLGATVGSSTRTVLIPGGIRAAFPAVSTRLVHNMKNTALVSFVAVPDLFQVIQGSITRTFRATEFLVLAAVLYLALSGVMTFGLQRIESRLWRGRAIRRDIGV